MECFTAYTFCNFLPKTPKFGFWVAAWVLATKSKHFGDFLQVFKFPKILRFFVGTQPRPPAKVLWADPKS